MDNQQQIQDLLRRIDKLNGQQASVQNTINGLREEVNALAQKLNTETEDAIEDSMVAMTLVKEPVKEPVKEVAETRVEKPILLPFTEVTNTDSHAKYRFSEANSETKTANSENALQEAPPPYEAPFEVKKKP